MITDTLQAFILATYCAFLWVAIAHFVTCCFLSLCSSLKTVNQPANVPGQSSESLTPQPVSTPANITVIPYEPVTKIITSLGIRELKALASERKIRGYGKLSKAELIAVLSD